jgi:hypothetical protein
MEPESIMTETLIELLDKHISMPTDDDHQHGWRRACEFIKKKIVSGAVSASEIPVIDESALINLVEEIADLVKAGRPYIGAAAAKVRPYLREPKRESGVRVSPYISIAQIEILVRKHLWADNLEDNDPKREAIPEKMAEEIFAYVTNQIEDGNANGI